MAPSFHPWFRRAAIALWFVGLVVVLALNRWHFDIVERSALVAGAVLMGAVAAVLAVVLNSARARRLVVADEARFRAQAASFGWVVAAAAAIMAACLFKAWK
jgi:hypothetical protein